MAIPIHQPQPDCVFSHVGHNRPPVEVHGQHVIGQEAAIVVFIANQFGPVFKAPRLRVGQVGAKIGTRFNQNGGQSQRITQAAPVRTNDAQTVAFDRRVKANFQAGFGRHVGGFRQIEPDRLHKAVAGLPLAAGETAESGMGIALGDNVAKLVDQVNEEVEIAGRPGRDFPIQLQVKRLAGGQTGSADLVIAQHN